MSVDSWDRNCKHGTGTHSTHGGLCCPQCLFHLSSGLVRIYLTKEMGFLLYLSVLNQNCRSIEQLTQKAISETTSHMYNETLPFPSLTFCPGFKNTASLHKNNGIDTVSKTFVEAEQKLRNLSSLVVDVGHVLPNR